MAPPAHKSIVKESPIINQSLHFYPIRFTFTFQS